MKTHGHSEKDCGEMHFHHGHSHHHTHAADENILVAFFLNLFFVFVEIIGGVLTNSFAILSDGVHDFGDCVAIGFAFFMEKYSQKDAFVEKIMPNNGTINNKHKNLLSIFILFPLYNDYINNHPHLSKQKSNPTKKATGTRPSLIIKQSQTQSLQ